MLLLLGTHGEHIHSVEFDAVRKELKLLQTTRLAKDPSWLTKHPLHEDIVYSNGHVDGKIFCLRVASDGSIAVLGEAKTGGTGPTHLALNHDSTGLLIAHYGQGETGFLALMPLGPNGRFASNKTTHHFHPKYKPSDHPRFDAPHVHHVTLNGPEVITCDLGSNNVWRLQQTATGWEDVRALDGFEAGDGPRHSVVHPDGHTVYVLNEVSSTLTAHTLPTSGPSQLVARFSILPPEDPDNGDLTAAEIILLPPAKPSAPGLLLCTNRFSKSDKGDAIALFAVESDGSVKPAPQPYYHGVGQHIRALAGDDSGKYIAAAGRDGGGLVVLERTGEDGLGLAEVARLDLPLVVVPLWL